MSATNKILVILSEFGYWGEELIGPMEVLEGAGYDLDYATPHGRKPPAITVSMDPGYIDPPLGRPVTSSIMAEKVRSIDSGGVLDEPINIEELLPERPYRSESNWLRAYEQYTSEVDETVKRLTHEYDALLLVGGSGPIIDVVNNYRIHEIILGFVSANVPVAAECYGVAALAFARDPLERRSIIEGKHVTGHCIEYDYQDGTGFMGTDFVMGPPPYPLEYILRDATGPNGGYHGRFGHVTSVIVDYPFITGRSTPDSYLTGQKLVEVLRTGLRQWGFMGVQSA